MAAAAQRLHPIAFELLRHGPPHNQLLSKITDYVALCGNFGAETLRLPFNHLEHQMNLEALCYSREGKAVAFKLDEMGNVMGDLMGSVPGLPSALSQAKDSQCDIAHLRLVLTPNELALLPFECATVPKGAPGGAGSKLLLQTNAPVTMTREVRGLTANDTYWPAQPRILFAWASPSGVDEVPYEEHLLVLRKAVTPWLEPYRGSGTALEEQEFMVRQFKRLVTVIPHASIDDIYHACSCTPFTHVHILAHGIPSPMVGAHQTVGIALHGKRGNDMEIIDGRRLANALRFCDKSSGELPSMVVLATCDSAQVRSVITHGGSIAHELHIAGVPLVVASQFPLSKMGSVVMADELYRRVFQAEDPRIAMHFVRRRLFSACGDFHDWASLVVYASLPRDFEVQLAEIQFKVAKRRIDRLLDEADAMIDRTARTSKTRQRARLTEIEVTPEDAYEKLMNTLDALEGPAKEILERTEDRLEGLGLQASTKKRKAEVLFWASKQTSVNDSSRRNLRSRSLTALAEARTLYQKAMKLNMSRHWVGVQFLCLTAVLHAAGKLRENYSENIWIAIKVSAENELSNSNAEERAWAHASMVELMLLKYARSQPQPAPAEIGIIKNEFLFHAKSILDWVPSDSFIVYSTCRQVARYVDWWSQDLDPKFQFPGLQNVSELASQAVQILEP